jgi:hypothetical protein
MSPDQQSKKERRGRATLLLLLLPFIFKNCQKASSIAVSGSRQAKPK